MVGCPEKSRLFNRGQPNRCLSGTQFVLLYVRLAAQSGSIFDYLRVFFIFCHFFLFKNFSNFLFSVWWRCWFSGCFFKRSSSWSQLGVGWHRFGVQVTSFWRNLTPKTPNRANFGGWRGLKRVKHEESVQSVFAEELRIWRPFFFFFSGFFFSVSVLKELVWELSRQIVLQHSSAPFILLSHGWGLRRRWCHVGGHVGDHVCVCSGGSGRHGDRERDTRNFQWRHSDRASWKKGLSDWDPSTLDQPVTFPPVLSIRPSCPLVLSSNCQHPTRETYPPHNSCFALVPRI